MGDPWFYEDDDDNSSYCSLVDSDKVDSETEAELYSLLHHEPNLSCSNDDNLNENTPGNLVLSSFKEDSLSKNEGENASIFTANEQLSLNRCISDNFSSEKRKSPDMDLECGDNSKKSSPLKKFKSTSQNSNLNVGDFKNANDSFQFKMNNIQNKNTENHTDSNDKLNNKYEEVVLQSSDSDSDIWILPNSADKSDLRINLLNDADIVFSSLSDSDNEPGVSSPYLKRDSFLRNLSMPNINTAQNSMGQWNINSEDLYRSKRHSNRYHDHCDITCSNCNKKGHTSRTCSVPKVVKCFFCGGNHAGFRCPKRLCSNCHAFGHDWKNCRKEVFRGPCHLCNMEGHAKGNCPDLWRRYHLTTSPSKIKKGIQVKRNVNLYCWNCGKRGHSGVVCPLLRSSKSGFSTLPWVVSYDNPKALLKNRLNILRKNSFLSIHKWNENIKNISSAENIDVHLQSRNQSNGFNELKEESGGNKNRKKNSKNALRLNKNQNIAKGKDFPRTPKKSPITCANNSEKSEQEMLSPKILMKRQLNKLKLWFRKQVRKNGLSSTESKASATQGDASNTQSTKCVMISEDLPQSVKLIVEKKFKRYKRNYLNRQRKRKQKEELTKS